MATPCSLALLCRLDGSIEDTRIRRKRMFLVSGFDLGLVLVLIDIYSYTVKLISSVFVVGLGMVWRSETSAHRQCFGSRPKILPFCPLVTQDNADCAHQYCIHISSGSILVVLCETITSCRYIDHRPPYLPPSIGYVQAGSRFSIRGGNTSRRSWFE